MGGLFSRPQAQVQKDEKKQKVEKKQKEEKKKRRDLYLEMMRQEFPDFASIPEDQLLSEVKLSSNVAAGETVAAGEPVAAAAALAEPETEAGTSAERELYECRTQENGTLEELFLGLYRGKLTLWKSGSTINWTARADGYPEPGMAVQAAVAVYLAAEQWNKVLEGRVTFKYVSIFDDAAFTLTFNPESGNTLARAFFPDSYERTMNLLYVFRRGYMRDVRRHFVNTMLHELGHILGLRHEHSQSGIKNWLGPGRDSPPEDRPRGAESILWGARNPKSVMAYYRGQEIQDSDIESIRKAYDDLKHGTAIQGQGRFDMIRKTIARVEPNN